MRKALGRGLDALIPAAQKEAQLAPGPNGVVSIPVERVRPNHLQPRRNFDPEKLSELAASIKEHGVAQPILVSHDAATDTYELIAGERRLRAAQLVGLKEIEAIVRSPESEKKRLAIALVENLQREDLNPIEQAVGYLRMVKEFGLTKTELAQIVGKSQPAVSNTLRLLNLPEEMQKALRFGQISEGHARALLMVENPLERKTLFEMIQKMGASVRETEDLARKALAGHPMQRPKTRVVQPKPADIKAVESELEHSLGTRVEIRTRKDPTKGTIKIHFYSLADFDNIVKMLKI